MRNQDIINIEDNNDVVHYTEAVTGRFVHENQGTIGRKGKVGIHHQRINFRLFIANRLYRSDLHKVTRIVEIFRNLWQVETDAVILFLRKKIGNGLAQSLLILHPAHIQSMIQKVGLDGKKVLLNLLHKRITEKIGLFPQFYIIDTLQVILHD